VERSLPDPLHNNLALHMGMPAKTAEKWSGNLRDWLLDGATAIWHLRCREVNDGKLPDSEATTRMRGCAVELWRNMESEIPPLERSYTERYHQTR
jgi:hypothetical protein